MRTNKKERKYNAREFYDFIKSSYRYNSFAIIFDKNYSKTNPNIIRTQMIATNPSFDEKLPCVIAESNLGYANCFYEFLENVGIKNFSIDDILEILHIGSTIMTEHDKEVWNKREELENQLGFEIRIIDNYVMLLERKV